MKKQSCQRSSAKKQKVLRQKLIKKNKVSLSNNSKFSYQANALFQKSSYLFKQVSPVASAVVLSVVGEVIKTPVLSFFTFIWNYLIN